MSKYKSSYRKGQLVYKVETYGDNRGKIDDDRLYRIYSIGPKQCTLEHIDPKTMQPIYTRKHNVYLYTEAEARESNRRAEGSSWRGFYPWLWSQLLVVIGQDGWDPDFNSNFEEQEVCKKS